MSVIFDTFMLRVTSCPHRFFTRGQNIQPQGSFVGTGGDRKTSREPIRFAAREFYFVDF